MLNDESFVVRYKRSTTDFTRSRVLGFKAITLMLLAQGTRSLQCALNELIPQLGLRQQTVSKVAYSKARHKLKHTAFIAMNQETVVQTMYEGGDYQTWNGFRILGVDGSKVMLPMNDETIKEFGTIRYDNKQGQATWSGEHCYALASILYDVLNRVAIDSKLVSCRNYEVDVAAEHLACLQDHDLAIYDRGYCSYRMMALATQATGDFLIRCSSGGFRIVADMLTGKGPDDVTTTLRAPSKFLANPNNNGLPTTLTVRFVRVSLDGGKYEVLATSLLDQQQFTPADSKELYWMRWGVETFYGILKTRLGLENFSGYSPEAIRQDFFATVFLTGAETLLTEDAEEQLGKQHGGHPKKVNKAMSFSAIRDHAFELFYSKRPDEERLIALTELFMTSPTLVRKDRKPPRSTATPTQRLSFWKRKRKVVV